MPRKSTASLTVVPKGNPLGRPEPFDDLSEREKAIWRAVVATKPADWWADDNLPLLADYCRHIVRQSKISQLINDFTADGSEDGVAALDRLLRMSERESKVIMALATKMRLSQQSKYGARQADTAARKEAKGKPWAFGKDD